MILLFLGINIYVRLLLLISTNVRLNFLVSLMFNIYNI